MSAQRQPAPGHCQSAAQDGQCDLLTPALQECPFEFYQWLHKNDPVHKMEGTDLFLVSRFDDVRRVLLDPETFSSGSNLRLRFQPKAEQQRQTLLTEHGWGTAPALQTSDPPAHSRHRRLVNRAFGPRAVAGLHGRIHSLAGELVDGFVNDGACEVVSQYADPFAATLSSELIGFGSDPTLLRRWADAVSRTASTVLTDEEVVANTAIELEAQHYLAELVRERLAEPRDDLLSVLAAALHGDAPLSMAEVLEMGRQLMNGGLETTSSAISSAVYWLARDEELRCSVRDDPARRAAFVEEVLRLHSPVQGLYRLTTRDCAIGEVPVPAGSVILVRFGAANWDASKFTEPGSIDLDRGSDSHLAFGAGPHFCVGAALARAEIAISVEVMLNRLGSIRLVDEPRHVPGLVHYRLGALNIAFAGAPQA